MTPNGTSAEPTWRTFEGCVVFFNGRGWWWRCDECEADGRKDAPTAHRARQLWDSHNRRVHHGS